MFLSRTWVSLSCFVLCLILCVHATSWEDQTGSVAGNLVKRDERKLLISTEFGRVSSAQVSDGNETFLLHFITLEPNSLFLPVVLHQDMVFYVHSGSGRLRYKDDDDKKLENVALRRGDVFRLESGTVFFLQSDLDPGRHKLRIHAIFGDAGEDLRDPVSYGPYSSIRDLVLGFDKRTLQETFQVSEEVIEEIRRGPKPEAITQGIPTTKKTKTNREYELIESFLIGRGAYSIFDTTNKNGRKSDSYNIFHKKRDFENCNGWSTIVTKKKYSLLKDSKYGLFMVNLTQGGMMGPHWNPRATEIAVVLEGKGIVRVVCPILVTNTECKNAIFAVEEGDVFVVPRFHPMAQLAFNNETFVFMGFSTSVKNNHPQYLAGKASVLRTLDRHILAISFGVNDTTFDKLMNQQGESVILECVSCAEEEYRTMQEEIEREREAARKREEEEARRREEEKRREEEEATKREEEEAARKREEEAAEKREEEEAARKREEEEAKRREEEEAKKREKEAATKREEEEAARKREEEEAKRREEEEAKKREEEAATKREEEEAARKREEEAAEKREEEEAARKREEEAAKKREEEAARKREEEAARKREEEQKRREEEEAQRGREQEAREEAAAREAEREREAEGRREAEAARRQEEEEKRRQQEAGQGGGGESQEGRGEQPPGKEGREESEAQRKKEAARQQEEPRQEQGGGTAW